MKTDAWFPVLLLAMMIGPLQAQVYLEVPSQLEIKSIDGESPPRKRLFSKDSTLELTDGAHEVVVYFYNIYEHGDEDYISFRSNPVTLKLQGQAGQRFRLEFTPPTRAEVEKEDDVDVAIRLVTLEADPMPQAPAPPVVHAEAPPAPPPVEKTSKSPKADVKPAVEARESGGLPLEMLQFWWKKASPQEREAFMKWKRSSP